MTNQDDLAHANATFHGFMRGIKIAGVIIGVVTLIVVLLIASGGSGTGAV